MEWIKEIWAQVSSLLKWWIIVLPWEQGLRIWCGKKSTLLAAGIHFRVPYFHSVYVQPVRITFLNLAPQTLTTKSGETLTIALIVGYSITDVSKLYNSVGEVESSITGYVTGNVASFVSNSKLEDCRPELIEGYIKQNVGTTDWGVSINELRITSYAIVKTFRIIQDGHWMGNSHKLDQKV